jgi:hypothetical protein
MGRVLKAVYANRYIRSRNNKPEIIYYSNGIPAPIIRCLEKNYMGEDYFNPYDCIDKLKNDSKIAWDPGFNLSNFHFYFMNKFGEENLITIDQIENDDAIYIFPLEIAATIDKLVDITRVDLDGVVYEYNLEQIIEPVIEYLRAGRMKIVICNIQDPCHDAPQIRKIELKFRELGIDESCLIFIFGNKFTNHSLQYPDSKTNFVSGDIALQQQARGMAEFPRQTSMGYVSDIVRIHDLNRKVYRPKKFLCFNRSMRSHRYYLAYMAMKQGLLDNSIFSFVVVDNSPENIKLTVENVLQAEISQQDADKLASLLPIELDTDHLTIDGKRSFVTDNNKKEWYADTYFHITSESSFFAPITDEPFFSEKTFRPIINLQPFIHVGDFGSLKKLKDLGFKTFEPYIDESYDQEPDHFKRMQMIEKEIVKLNSLGIEQLHNYYYDMVDRLIYNKNHFYSFKDIDPFSKTYELIRQLQ